MVRQDSTPQAEQAGAHLTPAQHPETETEHPEEAKMKLTDRNGVWIGLHAHVKITNPNHSYAGFTGTIVRMDREKRKVWVALPGGMTAQAGHRSVEVIL